MDTLTVPRHKDNILKALSQVPFATISQLAKLNDSLDPYKKASAILRQLEDQKLVEWEYHRQEKLWRLTRQGRKMMGVTATRSTKIDHALEVIHFYFSVRPRYWLYEPVVEFTHRGQELFWNPDAIFTMNKKLYCLELQRSPMGEGKWMKKWGIYGLYFNYGYFKDAPFQKWHKKPQPILPQFLCVTDQQPETVKQGFNVEGRELIISKVAH